MFRILRILPFVTTIGFTLGRDDISQRILGGRATPIEKRPYQVSLLSRQRYICGGSILSARWILTAAHCLRGVYRLQVSVGSRYRVKHGIILPARKLIIHPEFNKIRFDCDVGLIDMGEDAIPLNGVTVKTIKLIDSGETVPDYTEVSVSGWGRIDDEGTPTYTLMEMHSYTFNSQRCTLYYPRLTHRMICIAPGGMKTCKGDSGGPMVVVDDMRQIGTVSHGKKMNGSHCDFKKYPSIFARLSDPMIRDWIKNITGI